MLKRVSSMSRRDAATVVQPERALHEHPERCLLLFAPDAAAKQEYRSSPVRTDRYIAANALQRCVRNNERGEYGFGCASCLQGG